VKRALVICGDAWHPAEIVRRGLVPLCAEGFEFEFAEGEVSDLAVRLRNFSVVALAGVNSDFRDRPVSVVDAGFGGDVVRLCAAWQWLGCHTCRHVAFTSWRQE